MIIEVCHTLAIQLAEPCSVEAVDGDGILWLEGQRGNSLLRSAWTRASVSLSNFSNKLMFLFFNDFQIVQGIQINLTIAQNQQMGREVRSSYWGND